MKYINKASKYFYFDRPDAVSVIGGLTFGLSIAGLVFKLEFEHQVYPEFVPGAITWMGMTKTQDCAAIIAFLLFTVAGSFGLGRLRHALANRFGAHAGSSFSQLLLVCALPGAAWAGAQILNGAASPELLACAGVLVALASIVGLIALRSASSSLAGEMLDESGGALIAAALFAAMLPLGFAAATARLFAISLFDPIPVAIAAMFSAAAVLAILWIANGASIRTRLYSALIGAQIGLPLLFLTLLPARLVLPDQSTYDFPVTAAFWVVLTIAVAAGYADLARRAYSRPTEMAPGAVWHAISPVCVAAILVAVRFSSALIPWVSPDDYHFGENLVPWWSWATFGSLPFVDLLPSHGVSNYLSGAVGALFLDGTAASLTYASSIGTAFFTVATFLVLRRQTSTLAAFIAFLVLPYHIPNYLVLTIALCVFCDRDLLQRRPLWLACWVVLSTVCVLAVPGQGALVVVGTIPIGILVFLQAFRQDRQMLLRWAAAGLPVMVVLAVATPLPSMIVGALRYVTDNSAINTVAYGVPWSLSWSRPLPKSGPLFEMIRTSWVVLPVAAAFLIWRAASPGGAWVERENQLARAVPTLVVVFLIIPYSLGRIDPDTISRSGIISIWVWCLLLPLVLWPAATPLWRKAIMMIVAFAASTITQVEFSPRAAVVSATIPMVASPPLMEGAASGIRALGKGVVEPAHLDRLTRVKHILDQLLDSDETYLDLTGRGGHYRYFERRQPLQIAAPYNLAPLGQQISAVEKLEAETPPVVLLLADNLNFDGRNTSVRSHLLYRFVVEHYIPVMIDRFIFGIRPDRLNRLDQSNVLVTASNFSDVNWEKGINQGDAGFFVEDGNLIAELQAGDTVRFAGSGERKILKVDGRNVWVDGDHLKPAQDGHPHSITLELPPARQQQYRQALLDITFRLPMLDHLPVSWGRSMDSLRKRMREVAPLEGLLFRLSNLTKLPDGSFLPTGSDPNIIIDISQLGLSGRQAGLLALQFACEGRADQPTVEVYWSSDGAAGPTESTSLRFYADDGWLIVPMDAQPRWLRADHLHLLRIDVADPVPCQRIRISDISLYQRLAVDKLGGPS